MTYIILIIVFIVFISQYILNVSFISLNINDDGAKARLTKQAIYLQCANLGTEGNKTIIYE